MVNQDTPYGSVNYNQTGTQTFTGADGQTYSLPQFTQTTTLSPEQQSTLNYSQGAENNIAQTAGALSSAGLSNLSQAVDTSGAPGLATTLGSDYSTNLGSGYQTSYGDANTFANEYNNAVNSTYDQLKRSTDQNAEQSRAQMVASGIRQGSQAYSNNEQNINNAYTNDMNQAVQTGASLQNQLVNQSAQAAEFNNSSLTNQLTTQDNAALQAANYQNSVNQDWLQNYYQQRDAPLNELSSLLSGSQVTNATTGTTSTPTTSVSPTNYSGLVEQNYQAKLSQSQGLMSGLFGLAGAGAMLGGSYLGSNEEEEDPFG
ncbi:MAG: hypothetical protein ABF968_04785 [Acetobacter sp.]|uniref:hypothetical protein n=1 Tax=Acetobacter sp. TaxID=440 RepID=UPI0039E96F32